MLHALKQLALEFAVGTLVTMVIIAAAVLTQSPRAYERRMREGW